MRRNENSKEDIKDFLRAVKQTNICACAIKSRKEVKKEGGRGEGGEEGGRNGGLKEEGKAYRRKAYLIK